jgi:hypothetical protein
MPQRKSGIANVTTNTGLVEMAMAYFHRSYETEVVNQVYEDLDMGGPRLARRLTLDEKINLRAQRLQPK